MEGLGVNLAPAFDGSELNFEFMRLVICTEILSIDEQRALNSKGFGESLVGYPRPTIFHASTSMSTARVTGPFE
jgi:hypothetical protein